MKVLQINTVYGIGSTGKILHDIHDLCIQDGIQCYSGYRYKNIVEKWEDVIEISSPFDNRIHNFFSKYTMFKGWLSRKKTVQFLKQVEKYSPDIIHLHNLHGSYINIPLLFKYIKKNDIPVIWTMHDCWPFTAICPHFSIVKCDKWKTGCNHCPQKKKYSSAFIDNTKYVWSLKKKYFSELSNVTIVTPSNWMNRLVSESFLKEYDIKTIYNGIDLNVFKPTKSDFRKKYQLENKVLLLGVAFDWGYEKGLDVFLKLVHLIPENYVIVLVGTNDAIDAMLPPEIISIHRTNNQKELAQIYTAVDVFVNPTREEVLGLVNLEALGCGTPVVTFNAGGSSECIDESCGAVVEVDDILGLKKEIIRICEMHPYTVSACVERAKIFDKDIRLKEYIRLYESIEK